MCAYAGAPTFMSAVEKVLLITLGGTLKRDGAEKSPGTHDILYSRVSYRHKVIYVFRLQSASTKSNPSYRYKGHDSKTLSYAVQ
jgi:hypothetical protein